MFTVSALLQLARMEVSLDLIYNHDQDFPAFGRFVVGVKSTSARRSTTARRM